MNKISTLAFLAALGLAVPAIAQTPADVRNENAPAVSDQHADHMDAKKEHHEKMEHKKHHHMHHHKASEEHHDATTAPSAGH